MTNGDGVAGNPTITAAVLPAGVDHNSLANLTAGDVHTHYLRLVGRAGTANNAILSTTADGTLTGSSVAGSSLILEGGAHTAAVYGVPRVRAATDVGLIGNSLALGLEITAAATFDNAGSILNAFTVSEHGAWLVTADVLSIVTAGSRAFVYAPNIRNTVNRTDLGWHGGFFCAPSIYSLVGTTVSAGRSAAMSDLYNFGAGGINAGALTWTEHAAVFSSPGFNAGTGSFHLDARRGLDYRNKSGTGTQGTSLAVDVADQTVTVLAAALRSAIGSGSGKWFLLSTGTADSSLAGRLFVGGAASTVPNTDCDVDGDYATRAANLALVNGNNDNIAVGARSFIRITGPSAAFTIRGIASGFDGKRLRIYNTTTQNMTFNHEDAGSTAANRIRTMTGAAVATTGEGVAELIYDATLSRWLLCFVGV